MLNVTEIAARIANPAITKATDSEDLKMLAEKYPYTQLFSILYLQSLKQAGDIHFEDELKKHSFRITDRVQLFQLIESSHAVSASPSDNKLKAAHTSEDFEIEKPEIEEIEIDSIEELNNKGSEISEIEVEASEELKIDSSETEKTEIEAIEESEKIEIPEWDIHDDGVERNEESKVEIEPEINAISEDELVQTEEEILDTITSDQLATSEFEAVEIANNIEENQLVSEIEKSEIGETDISKEEIEVDVEGFEVEKQSASNESKELYSIEEAFKEPETEQVDPLEESIAHHVYAANYQLDSLSEEEERKLKEKQANSSTEPEFIPKRSEKKEGASFTNWLHANNNYKAPDEASLSPTVVPHFSDFDPSKALFGEQNRPKQEFFSAPKKAKKSLTEETLPVSETLAKVYSMQGNYPKAISAYEQLMLTIPEKKSFFASLIEELKTKLNT